jgi:DNA excision repair protein ERCC-2
MCFHSFIARNAPDAKSAMEICELLKAREQCPYYANIKKKKGFFNELRMHVSSSVYKASEIREICKVQGFCPYELVKEALEDVDVVALSYMYVFEPAIRGAFLKHLDKPLNKVILIVDEAHNLPDAALEIASENLTLFTVRQAQLESEKFRHKETEDFTRKFRIILEQMTSQIEEETYIPPQRLTDAIQKSINIKEPQTFFEEMHETGNLVKQELLTQGKYPRSYIHSVGEFFLR